MMRPLTFCLYRFPLPPWPRKVRVGAELSQPVADHFLGHEDLHMDLAVMHQERVPDELRDDRATARAHVLMGSSVPIMFCFLDLEESWG